MKPIFNCSPYAAISLILSALVFASCSSSDDSAPQNDGDLTASQRSASALAIAISAPPATDNYEVWNCLTETGLPIGYTFHRNGAFNGSAANLLLGKEIDPTNTNSSDHLRYVWSTTSESSLTLDAPDKGIQIDWTDIEINSDGTMSAFTSNRGQLLVCGRSTVAKNDAGSENE